MQRQLAWCRQQVPAVAVKPEYGTGFTTGIAGTIASFVNAPQLALASVVHDLPVACLWRARWWCQRAGEIIGSGHDAAKVAHRQGFTGWQRNDVHQIVHYVAFQPDQFPVTQMIEVALIANEQNAVLVMAQGAQARQIQIEIQRLKAAVTVTHQFATETAFVHKITATGQQQLVLANQQHGLKAGAQRTVELLPGASTVALQHRTLTASSIDLAIRGTNNCTQVNAGGGVFLAPVLAVTVQNHAVVTNRPGLTIGHSINGK